MVVHVTFAHSGYLLATTWPRRHDPALGCRLGRTAGGGGGEVFSSFAPDDRRLAFTTGGGIGVWDVSTAPERRTLHAGMTGNRAERRVDRRRSSGSVQSRRTAPGNRRRRWRPALGRRWGRELAHLKAGKCRSALFDSDGRGIITSGRWGVYRWPIRPDSGHGPDAISIGPPELLWESISDNELACASWLPDHRTLAIIDNARHKSCSSILAVRIRPRAGRSPSMPAGITA